MRGVDVVAAGDDVIVADLASDADVLATLMVGADAVVHLAAIASETDFDTAVNSHIGLTHRVLMPRSPTGSHGWCTPAVIMPSDTRRGHRCSGRTPGLGPTPSTVSARPVCEALCSLYHDRHGLTVACLRIGSFRDHPTTRRHLSTWLSPGDAIRLVDACLRSPDLGFAIVYGISANTRHLGPGFGVLARLRATRRRRGLGRRDQEHATIGKRRPRRSVRRWRLHSACLTRNGSDVSSNACRLMLAG